jgi:hypothetical protein
VVFAAGCVCGAVLVPTASALLSIRRVVRESCSCACRCKSRRASAWDEAVDRATGGSEHFEVINDGRARDDRRVASHLASRF